MRPRRNNRSPGRGHRRAAGPTLLALAALAGACDMDVPFDGIPDARLTDLFVWDRPTLPDAPRPDAPLPDAPARDAPPRDAPLPDAPPDTGSPDAGPAPNPLCTSGMQGFYTVDESPVTGALLLRDAHLLVKDRFGSGTSSSKTQVPYRGLSLPNIVTCGTTGTPTLNYLDGSLKHSPAVERVSTIRHKGAVFSVRSYTFVFDQTRVALSPKPAYDVLGFAPGATIQFSLEASLAGGGTVYLTASGNTNDALKAVNDPLTINVAAALYTPKGKGDPRWLVDVVRKTGDKQVKVLLACPRKTPAVHPGVKYLGFSGKAYGWHQIDDDGPGKTVRYLGPVPNASADFYEITLPYTRDDQPLEILGYCAATKGAPADGEYDSNFTTGQAVLPQNYHTQANVELLAWTRKYSLGVFLPIRTY